MPITRKQFELGIDEKTEEWMKKIHSFLAEHKDEAFSAEELYGTFTGKKLRIAIPPDEGGGFAYHEEEGIDFDAALEQLVETGAAEKRSIRGTDYYSYRRNPNPFEETPF